uniref:site-specific DNA-methyltransferase (adenine-specific) n=1 Tax=viral metagenome TaxID=1070528 RepID=A0A6C0C0C9_9ZZZZ
MVRSLSERTRSTCQRLLRKSVAVTCGKVKKSLGTKRGVAAALSRMCKNKELLRVSRGTYVPHACNDLSIPTSVFPWWGSKKRLVRPLVSIILTEVLRARCEGIRASRIVSPFVGTGIVEVTLQNLGEEVRAFDTDSRVVNMHRALRTAALRKLVARHFAYEVCRLRKQSAAQQVKRYKHILRDAVLSSSKSHGEAQLAARWNLGMRCSFFGMLRRSSGFVRSKPSKIAVGRICRALEGHRGLGNACARKDVFDVLRDTPRRDFLFLDPPYLLESSERQYEGGDFGLEKHAKLANALKGRNFVLCHREDPSIRDLYKWCEILVVPQIMNINRAGKSGMEMIIIGRKSGV